MKKLVLVTSFILALGAALMAQDCATGYCPANILVHHKQGSVSPASGDITYPVMKVTSGGTSLCIITRNLGASVAPTSITDATIAANGWYWQYNIKQGMKEVSGYGSPLTSWTTATINTLVNWASTNDPCTLLLGANWRIPSNADWSVVTGATGISAAGAWNIGYTSLKLNTAGFVYGATGQMYTTTTYAAYASSTASPSATGVYALVGNNTTYWALSYNWGMANAPGMPVRCVRTY